MSAIVKFDATNNPENLTLILAHRNGKKLGQIKAKSVVFKDSMPNHAEISFKVNKFIDNEKDFLWDKIVDFKLLWCQEADLWFEIYVEIDESNETIKSVSCVQLGKAETSQIMLYDIEINTENDIARDDYVDPTILYDKDKPERSLLHRIMEKAQHYSIIHVDNTIAKLQRTFTFNDISLYDAFQQISEEIKCLFVFHSNSDDEGKIQRTISVYDLESNCNTCGHRGEFTSRCSECGSDDIDEGYGEDTTIFVTSDELSNSIQFTSDNGSIKNCFKLEAGDDLMNATIRNCNPNGTDYIWHISNDVKEDMSEELVEKLESYDALCLNYQNDYVANIDNAMLKQYNDLVVKYQKYNNELQSITSPIQGYSSLMTAIYNTIDLSIFLESGLMPSITMSETNSEKQALLLTAKNLSPVSVANYNQISLATANSVVLSAAKIIIDARYRVKVNESSLNNKTWTGNFVITNYSDEEDEAISSIISVDINDDYELFVKQKLDKSLKDKDTDDLSITSLFKLDYDLFCDELKKYSLNSLTSFHDACQACIDILIEQGVANHSTWANSDPDLYADLYTPYYQKLKAIESELQIRENEINLIDGVYDTDGILVQNGLQPCLYDIKSKINELLDFQSYIGKDLWLELCSYRREDKYSNDNYISDGLSNSELFENALEFIKVAKNEIYKSAELQHSVSSTLKNLLVIKKFKPLIKYFKVGNWIRIMIDDKIHKLRLLEYEIDFDNIDSLSVDFSDVLKTASGEEDQKSIISKISSMASSYSSVKRQASQGSKSNDIIKQWNENGLDATNTKIIGGSDNQTQTWDSHGMLFRKYNAIIDTYDDAQSKIINSTYAITDDNWKTTKTAIGNFYYRDPKTGELISAYGINGEVIIGKLMIGEGLGIYNKSGDLTFDDNGFAVTNRVNTVTINPNDNSVFNIKNKDGNVLSFDENGELIVVGSITAKSLTLLDGTTINSNNVTGLSDVAISGDYNDLKNTPSLSTVATSGRYSDLTGTPNLASVATSGKYSDLTGTPEIKTTIESNGTSSVSGKAVYDFALSKNQGSSNAGKLLYVSANGDVTQISIAELKTLLGI